MANPNIISVSSIHGESIGEALTTTVTTDIMTVASNKLLKINYIQVANDHAVALPSDDVLVLVDKPIYLMEGDVLEGGANPATADIFISYEVIDDA